jgi:hypothetical protein
MFLRRFDLEHTFRFLKPRERPLPTEKITPARVRRVFRNIRADLPELARAPKTCKNKLRHAVLTDDPSGWMKTPAAGSGALSCIRATIRRTLPKRRG